MPLPALFHSLRHRSSLPIVAVCVGLTALALPAVTTTAAAVEPSRSGVAVAQDPPNVLIIVMDDQRLDLMKFMPGTRKLFRREGVRFVRAFATTPLCCPFRASLMTGQYAHNSGVRKQEDGPKLNQQHTLQRYLYEGGYSTALLGKYLNHWPPENPPPYFERFAMGKKYNDQVFNVDGTLKTINGYVPDYLGRRAVRLLRGFEAVDEKPWFMMLTPSTPHTPADPAPRHENVRVARWEGNPATFESDLSDKPPMIYRNGSQEGVRAKPNRVLYNKFARTLLAGDDLVIKVFNMMRTLEEDSNTLAFFMSDNGYLLGEHGLAKKSVPYPTSTQVPLYLRWPEGPFQKGVVDDRIVANIDILPTVLEATGLQQTDDHLIDGRALQSSQPRHRLLLEYFASARKPSWASLLTDREQYTEYYGVDEQSIAFREYYDVVTDPWRLTNTLGDDDVLNDPEPLTILELSEQLEADRACAGTQCP